MPTTVACEVCGGSGSEAGSEPAVCPSCRGAGRVRSQQGFFTVERTCPTCQGTGRVIKNPCQACGGSGVQQREKTLAVNIPAGVEDGTRIRLSGEGEAAIRGGQPGDLYIFVSVAPHRLFRREGGNIFCRVPIPMTTAALGGQVEVPTIEGQRVRIAVPAGTQAGKQIRLKSKGMSELHGHARGDMFVEIVVETPVNLTKRQQELLREFEQAGGGDAKEHQPESEGFFAKVKELWDDLRELIGRVCRLGSGRHGGAGLNCALRPPSSVADRWRHWPDQKKSARGGAQSGEADGIGRDPQGRQVLRQHAHPARRRDRHSGR